MNYPRLLMLKDKIVWKIIDTRMGRLMVGASDKGVCLTEFIDRKNLQVSLERLITDHNAELVYGSNEILENLIKELTSYFEGELKNFTVPIDIKGSPFHLDVWNALLKIPYGETTTYQNIAKVINNPNAIRAVGKANGENYLAIVIPCHRVIGSDGSLIGYGGGFNKKEKLLQMEARNIQANNLSKFINVSM